MTWTALHTRIVADGLSAALVREVRDLVVAQGSVAPSDQNAQLCVLATIRRYLQGPAHKGVRGSRNICKNPVDGSACRDEICCAWKIGAVEVTAAVVALLTDTETTENNP